LTPFLEVRSSAQGEQPANLGDRSSGASAWSNSGELSAPERTSGAARQFLQQSPGEHDVLPLRNDLFHEPIW